MRYRVQCSERNLDKVEPIHWNMVRGLSSAPQNEGSQQMGVFSLETSEGHGYLTSCPIKKCVAGSVIHRAEVGSLGLKVNGDGFLLSLRIFQHC